MLGLGKVTKKVFDRAVMPFLPINKIELDGTVVELSEKTVVAHSPSIGVPLEALGFFAFHYAASNVASKFGKPTHMITGIYLPLKTLEKDLRVITDTLGTEAKKYGVEVIAGQTGTYYGLEIPLITSSCLGELIRTPEKPESGDLVIIIGEVGAEGLWLEGISRGERSEDWRNFTPLPIILELQECEYVKVMHDVSEGGVKGALFEIVDSLKIGMEVNSTDIKISEILKQKSGDPLRSPSYGTLIIIIDNKRIESVKEICSRKGYKFSKAGFIKKIPNLVIDNEIVREHKRVELDEVYGSFKIKDENIIELEDAYNQLLKIEELSSIIPQVGTNLVYSKDEAETIKEVAGLTGRIVNAMGKPLCCGEIKYGASIHLAGVVLEAKKIDPSIRSAINIKHTDSIFKKLEKMGLKVKVLPSKISGKGCPVTVYIRKFQELFEVYIHPGDFGVEPTTTIIGKHPQELVKIIIGLFEND